MTKEEAKNEIENGKKMTHEYFLAKEFVKKDGDDYLLEDGVRLSPEEFWAHRKDEFFNEGWSLFAEET